MNSRKKEGLGSKRKGNNKSKRAKGMSRCCNNNKNMYNHLSYHQEERKNFRRQGG